MGRSAVALNKKAGFDVEVEQKFEAGIVLTGDEIKSIRENRAQLTGGYVKLLGTGRDRLPEVVLIGLHLGKAKNPERSRKLLLHAREVREIEELLAAKGRTAVALSVYLQRGWAKVTIGIGRGRKQYDKRQLLKSRDITRQERSALKGVYKG